MFRAPERIAIVSTPRSGNTWLWMMLQEAIEAEGVAVYEPSQIDWEALGRRAVLQLHWWPTEGLRDILAREGFRTVTLARHPLAVLVSILNFSAFENTERWLGGKGGDESGIIGVSPSSEAFVDYATSARARALLGISLEWSEVERSPCVRYEEMKRDPAGTVGRLLEELGFAARTDLGEIAKRKSLDALKRGSRNQHFWKGDPDLWRSVMTAPVANRIAEAHSDLFERLDYVCDPDGSLTKDRATEAWLHLAVTSASEQVQRLQADLARLEEDLRAAER